MQVHYDLDLLPPIRRAVITIGTFDGVHRGHRQVLDRLVSTAQEVGGESVLITFHPHPRKVIHSAILGIRLINTLSEKIELLENSGIDHVVVVPFTEAFANLTAPQYISDFLIQRFQPHTIIIGHDHQFGRGRNGNYQLLEQYANQFNYQLKEIPKHVLKDISVSSTNIREAILQGRATTANQLLGYEFFFSGRVIHGNKLGRTLGYPTANLKIEDPEKLVPGNGIYAVYAFPENHREPLKGMMSIGLRPTVDGKNRVIEVNIFDFNREIYDEVLKVQVHQYLREERKFDSLQALVVQIDQDKVDSLAIL